MTPKKDKKDRKKKEEVKIVKKPKSNDKIEEIISNYPIKLTAYPRGAFEEQLRQHLLRHGVK